MVVDIAITGTLPYGVTKSLIKQIVAAAYKHVGGKKKVHVAVSVVGDSTMKRLNRQHRGIDKTTDVLSFPYLNDDEFIGVIDEEGYELLGELVISAEQVKRQAKQIGRRIRDEFALMLVHGTLHLLGYDHITKKEEDEMFSIQQDILMNQEIF